MGVSHGGVAPGASPEGVAAESGQGHCGRVWGGGRGKGGLQRSWSCGQTPRPSGTRRSFLRACEGGRPFPRRPEARAAASALPRTRSGLGGAEGGEPSRRLTHPILSPQSCQADLVKDSGHKYFLSVLADPYMPVRTPSCAVGDVSWVLTLFCGAPRRGLRRRCPHLSPPPLWAPLGAAPLLQPPLTPSPFTSSRSCAAAQLLWEGAAGLGVRGVALPVGVPGGPLSWDPLSHMLCAESATAPTCAVTLTCPGRRQRALGIGGSEA